jgi:hypothetical protein
MLNSNFSFNYIFPSFNGDKFNFIFGHYVITVIKSSYGIIVIEISELTMHYRTITFFIDQINPSHVSLLCFFENRKIICSSVNNFYRLCNLRIFE